MEFLADGADNWGGIYDNESSDGMLGDIYEQRVEMAIGCIYNWYDGITETSHTIARSSVTILGPAPAWVSLCLNDTIKIHLVYVLAPYPAGALILCPLIIELGWC